MLVNDMARHYWLYQRALRLQETCFAADITAGSTQNQLSLYLRYGTTHERAFRRCLADLLKLRKERLRLERGFESQARERAAEVRRETREQRLTAHEKRAAEAYEKEKNRPPTLSPGQPGVGTGESSPCNSARLRPPSFISSAKDNGQIVASSETTRRTGSGKKARGNGGVQVNSPQHWQEWRPMPSRRKAPRKQNTTIPLASACVRVAVLSRGERPHDCSISGR
jgi:hypothetical protein